MPSVSAVVPRPKTGASRTRPAAQQRAGRTLFWLTAACAFIATLARNGWVFTQHVYEHGDAALITIMVQNSHHSLLLTGPVSRVGFPHPGPAYIYVQAAGQALFHDWLPLTASAYGGQFVADSILQAVLLGFVIRTLYRLTRSVPAGLIAFGIVFWFAASREMLGETWLPNLYMSTFTLLIISSIAVSLGVTRELPLLVFSGAMLIHGHVAFIFFVGATWLLSASAWLRSTRPRPRAELRAARPSLWWSLGIALVFALPLVLEVVLHFPGPWPDYLNYNGGRGNDSIESLSFLGHFWTASYPLSLTIVAAAAAIAGLLLDHDKDRSRLFVRGYLMLLLQTALFLYYILQGIDALVPVNYYTGYFYENVPMFLLVLSALHLSLLAWQHFSARQVLGWAAAVAVLALVVGGVTTPSLTMKGQSYPTAVTAVQAMAAAPDRQGRPIVLRFQHDEWSFVAAMFVQARRMNVPVCITDPYWQGLFTQAAMCPTTAGHWAVADAARLTDSGSRATNVIWTDGQHVIYQGTLPDLPPATK